MVLSVLLNLLMQNNSIILRFPIIVVSILMGCVIFASIFVEILKKSMKILITGASGFIGSFLVEEALRRGMEVWAGIRRTSSRVWLTDPRIHFITLDLDDTGRLCEQLRGHRDAGHGGWTYVVHCAGATKCLHAADFDRANYEATVHLVEALRTLDLMPRRFVYISSLSVYGPVHESDYAPISDHDTPQPNTAYGRSKLKAERYLQSLSAFPYIIFRPTGVYGPRERDYYLMVKAVKRGLDVTVGFRRQDLTFVHVADLVQAVFRAIDRNVYRRAYFVSDGNVYSSRDFSDYVQKELKKSHIVHLKFPLYMIKLLILLAEMIARSFHRTSTLNRDKYNIMKQRNWRCDIAPLIEEVDYCPEYDLERGVKETVAWYKKEKWL